MTGYWLLDEVVELVAEDCWREHARPLLNRLRGIPMIIHRDPSGKPTGVYHPEPHDNRHFAPTPVAGSHADLEKRRMRAGGPIAPTGPDPMLGAQLTDYFADAYAANAPDLRP